MADILDQTDTLLTSNWNATNTAGRTPIIKKIFEVKRIDMGIKPQDYILVSSLNGPHREDNASGAKSKKTDQTIGIDIRTTLSHAQLVLIENEVARILDNKQINPFSDGTIDITDLTDFDDRSDESVGLFYSNVKWRLQALNVAI